MPKGLAVLSYDLVSDGAFVVEADVCARVPLPGGEGDDVESVESGEGRAQVADVVVCALSLMSTNWVGCVREAWRVLRLKYVCLSFQTLPYAVSLSQLTLAFL